MRPRRIHLLPLLVALGFLSISCSGGAGTTSGAGATSTPAGGGASAAASQAPYGGGAAGSGALTVEGSLTSSGLYSAMWAWETGLAADVGDTITLHSDKGTFGNIEVKEDGSISFGSGAPELSKELNFAGTGAQVKLGPGAFAYVCGFTLDNDLTADDGKVLHLKGTLTIHSDDSITPC